MYKNQPVEHIYSVLHATRIFVSLILQGTVCNIFDYIAASITKHDQFFKDFYCHLKYLNEKNVCLTEKRLFFIQECIWRRTWPMGISYLSACIHHLHGDELEMSLLLVKLKVRL